MSLEVSVSRHPLSQIGALRNHQDIVAKLLIRVWGTLQPWVSSEQTHEDALLYIE